MLVAPSSEEEAEATAGRSTAGTNPHFPAPALTSAAAADATADEAAAANGGGVKRELCAIAANDLGRRLK